MSVVLRAVLFAPILLLAATVLLPNNAASFTVVPTPVASKSSSHIHPAPPASFHVSSALSLSSSSSGDAAATTTIATRSRTSDSLRVPLTWDEMIRQVASTVKDAATRGQHRQIVRILLPRDASSGEFGRLLESNNVAESTGSGGLRSSSSSIVLVPPDESWQGGIMQLYRAVLPTCTDLVRRLCCTDASGGVPPRVVEDRSVDESGVDGVGLLTTSDGSISCWLQPTQDNVDDIVQRSQQWTSTASTTSSDEEQESPPLQLLVNPQWRMVDDALDSASKGQGLLAGMANFLGGKGRSLQKLADAGFVPVYTLEGYVCRGSNVRLLHVDGSDWAVFCERDDQESFVKLGTLPARPTYQQVDELLQKADIGYKYARDIGLSPKL